MFLLDDPSIHSKSAGQSDQVRAPIFVAIQLPHQASGEKQAVSQVADEVIGRQRVDYACPCKSWTLLPLCRWWRALARKQNERCRLSRIEVLGMHVLDAKRDPPTLISNNLPDAFRLSNIL